MLGTSTHDDKALLSELEAETTARTNADIALQDAIDLEASAREAALEELNDVLSSLGITDVAGLVAALAGKADLVDGYVNIEQIPVVLLGAMRYQGTWNASTNSPLIPGATALNKGHYYRVAVAGTTPISGISDWQVADWIVSNGTSWDKIDNSEIANDDLTTTAQDPSNANAVSSLRAVISNLFTAITAKADRLLSNLSDVVTARANLGLGGAATRNVGNMAGTVAAGDDGRFGSLLTVDVTGLSGTVSLTADQASKSAIQVTGAPAGTVDFSFPSGTRGNWTIYNAISNGNTIRFRLGTGGATAVSRLYATILVSDGTIVQAPFLNQSLNGNTVQASAIQQSGQNVYAEYNMRNLVEWFIDFEQGIFGAPLNSSISGSGAILSPNASAATQGRPGIVQYGTGTTDSGRVAVLSSDNGYYLGGNSSVWETELALPGGLSTNTEQYLVRAGWFNAYTNNTSGQTGVAFFEYDQRISPNWLLGTGTARVDSGVPVIAGSSPVTFIRLRIEIDANNNLRFYINSTLVNSQTNASGLTVPTASCVALNKVAGTTSANLRLDYMYWKIALSNPRT